MSCRIQTLLLCGLTLAHARFLYKEEPLVRVSPAVGDSDLFGYAVAFHRIDDTGEDDFYHSISNTISPGALKRLHRMVSEENKPNRIQRRAITKTVDCSQDQESCTEIVCNISDFKRETLSIVITSQVDNRFFQSQNGDFEFYAYAHFKILTFKEDESSIRSNRLVVQEKQQEQDKQVSVWIFVVSSVAALLILALMILLLYLICYFRLRHKAKAREQRNLVSAHCLTENDIDTKEDLDSLKPVDLDEDSQGGENNELHEKPPTDPPRKARVLN